MKRNLLLLAVLAAVPASAVEITLGQGSFTTEASLKGMAQAAIDLDITTLSLQQKPNKIKALPFFWSAQLTLFQSDFVNRVTDFASQPVRNDIPFIGGSIDDLASSFTAVPVPADYRVYGMDFNIGIGYPLLDNDQGTFRIGVNSGLSLPFMKTRNMRQDANLFLDLLEATSTEIETLKLGPAIDASWRLAPTITLYGNWIYNHQWGRLDNDLLGSGIGIDGGYSQLDFNIELRSKTWPRYLKWLGKGHLTLGYRHTRWNYDTATFNFQQASADLPATLDMTFEKTVFHAGVGVAF